MQTTTRETLSKRCANAWCLAPFQITDDMLALYEKVSPVFGGKTYTISPPSLCPECRKQRRFSFRNERNFYRGVCAMTGSSMVSQYPPISDATVYDQKTWWSDQYDPLSFGRAFDPNASFLQQFHALDLTVPKVSIQNAKSENCDYTNYSNENVNCYMLIDGGQSQSCHFSYRIAHSRDCIDCYDLLHSELCYECSESRALYSAIRTRQCVDCSDVIDCSFCHGCRDCIGCINLRNKQYCIFNKQYDKEAYLARKRELLQSPSELSQEYAALILRSPHSGTTIVNSEQCSGDNLNGCRRCRDSFIMKDSEDCHYAISGENDRSLFDADFSDNCELQGESCGLQLNYNVFGCCLVWYCKYAFYSISCLNSTNIFGCSGLKGQHYCILNKQYTKEEYEALVPKIIEKMRADGEWGEFFPAEFSSFGYNDTVAHEYLPLSKEEVIKRGWKWNEYEAPPLKADRVIKGEDIPGTIDDVPDEILDWAIECEATKKPFKIIRQELDFYRRMHVSVPRIHPNERHQRRMMLRNPWKLWERSCAKCQEPMMTSYSPERPEIVYCEKCYLKEVY